MAGIRQQIRVALASARKLTCAQKILVFISVLFVSGGGAGQLLALNEWIAAFPGGGDHHPQPTTTGNHSPSIDESFFASDLSSVESSDTANTPVGLEINPPFTILTVGAITQALVYMTAFWGRAVVRRPRLGFLKTTKSAYLSAAIGFTVSLNGVLLVCATGNTPEILQAFLLSTIVLWTFLFVKVIFAEKRSYISPLVGLSFLLSMGGIVAGSAGSFKASGMNGNTIAWSMLFAAGMIPGALNSVIAAKYMRNFEEPTGFIAPLPAESKGASTLLGDVNIEEEDYEIAAITTDSDTSKYAMLCFGNLWQSLFMFCLLPLGALPWFGVSKDLGSLLTGIGNGYKCTFNQLEGCDHVWVYFALFNAAFVFSSIGSMFLNYYSPAINSMVSQLSSPLAAVVLLIFPGLNTHHHGKDKSQIGLNIVAIILITSGSIVYSVWEESTRAKESGRISSTSHSNAATRHSGGRNNNSISLASGNGRSSFGPSEDEYDNYGSTTQYDNRHV